MSHLWRIAQMLKSIKKVCSGIVVFSLLWTAPGIGTYQALAQVRSGKAGVPVQVVSPVSMDVSGINRALNVGSVEYLNYLNLKTVQVIPHIPRGFSKSAPILQQLGAGEANIREAVVSGNLKEASKELSQLFKEKGVGSGSLFSPPMLRFSDSSNPKSKNVSSGKKDAVVPAPKPSIDLPKLIEKMEKEGQLWEEEGGIAHKALPFIQEQIPDGVVAYSVALRGK
ncbi:MAG: hypothetical protein HY400_06910, partial [Elusimicrobia bacterium]|nr:hypothetical protein [Elusimicrobiota bacterium]